MFELESTFNKRNVKFDMVKRNKYACIYKISKPENDYELGYEVHRIGIQEERTAKIAGKVVVFKNKEIIADDDEFGEYGWHYTDLKNAERKYLSVCKTRRKKLKEKKK